MIHEINIDENIPSTIGIFTDSRITIESLKNATNHSFVIEEIKKRVMNLERTNCTIDFAWVKVHVGIYGNELADHLAKAAASSTELAVTFDRTPKCTLYSEIEEDTQKWQQECERSTKAAVAKQFFPNVRNMIKLNININPNFTAVVTVHGKISTYLQRCKLAENSIFPCNKEDQTLDHTLNSCALLHTQRNTPRKYVTATGTWPPIKEEFIAKYLKPFLIFTKSIDYEQL